ncbi:hypothetical protein J2X36_005366 [Methylobacterium sp. BE186]|nr:hypothetical protein [Methylobacterium sp. BE186]
MRCICGRGKGGAAVDREVALIARVRAIGPSLILTVALAYCLGSPKFPQSRTSK